MSKITRSLVIVFGIGLLLLFLIINYFTEIAGPIFTEDPDQEIPVEEPVFFKEVNFYELIYSSEKDPAVGLAAKEQYVAEMQPEPEPPPKPKPPASSAVNSQKEQQMINYINQARNNAGLPSLTANGQLTTAARAKSRDMVEKNYFGHVSPTYGNMADLLRNFGINYRSAGENLAMNSSGSVLDAHNMLMNSPGHRSNIMNPGYSTLGVGIHIKSDGSHYYTQLFVGY